MVIGNSKRKGEGGGGCINSQTFKGIYEGNLETPQGSNHIAILGEVMDVSGTKQEKSYNILSLFPNFGKFKEITILLPLLLGINGHSKIELSVECLLPMCHPFLLVK